MGTNKNMGKQLFIALIMALTVGAITFSSSGAAANTCSDLFVTAAAPQSKSTHPLKTQWRRLRASLKGFGQNMGFMAYGPSDAWRNTPELTMKEDGSYSLYDFPVQFFNDHGNPVILLRYNQAGTKFRPTQQTLPNFLKDRDAMRSIGPIKEFTRKKPVIAFFYPEPNGQFLNVVVMDGHHRTYVAATSRSEIHVEILNIQEPEDWHISGGSWGRSPLF